MGDAISLSSLSLYQQGVAAFAASGSWTAPATFNVGAATIRGCRLSLCLYVCEKFFKAVRAPASQREVPVPIEAAALALLVNLCVEYWIATLYSQGADDGLALVAIPRTLAASLGGTPIDAAVAFLTIVAWRVIYAASLSGF